MKNNDKKSMGTITVSKSVLMQLAWYIAKSSEGVLKVADTSKKNNISRFLKKKDEPEGVYITKTKDGIIIDVCVILKYGADSKLIRETVADKVKNEIAGLGLKIKEVNVRIEGVRNRE